MYRWLWRHLPGGTAMRTACALALAVVAVLFLVVFPAVDAHLPPGEGSVGGR